MFILALSKYFIMSKIERENKRRLLRVEYFFNSKKDIYNNFSIFEKAFQDYKAHTKNNNVWILDELTYEQKELFHKHYSFALSGGGNYYSIKYCNDKEYRSEYHFPRQDDNVNLVLIKK